MPTTFPERKSDWNSPTAPTQSAYRLRSSDWNGVVDQITGWLNAKSYGAVGDGTTDDTAALAAWLADATTGTELLLPAGTYKSTAALTVSVGNIKVRGVRGASILKFTGATDGIVISDNTTVDKYIDIEGIEIQTSSATGGKAINCSFPTNAGTNISLRNLKISKSGSGLWAYGVYGDNWQTSGIYNIRVQASATVSYHLQNSCNALHFYACEASGHASASRGMEVAASTTSSEVYWHGGTIQANFAAALLSVTASSFTGYGVHFENTNAVPSDGADIVTAGASPTVTLYGGGAPSITTAGTTPALVAFGVGGKAITLGASTRFSILMGCNCASYTDNTPSALVSLGNRLTAGSMVPTHLPQPFSNQGSTSGTAVTAAMLFNTLTLMNNEALAGLDAAGTSRPMLKTDASSRTVMSGNLAAGSADADMILTSTNLRSAGKVLWITNGLGGNGMWMTWDGMLGMTGVAFANLGTPANGTIVYCPDATYGSNPAVGGGTGAFVKRVNGAWRAD